MDFNDLNAFAHVARLQSYSRASAHMRVAQSALSRRVQRLEHQVGVALFERHGRGIRLTEPGGILLEKAETLLRMLQQVEYDILTVAKEPTGHIRLAMPPVTGQALAADLVDEYRRAYPRVGLHILEGYSGFIHDWIIKGTVDAAILYNPQKSSELDVMPLIVEPVYLIGRADDPFFTTPDGPRTQCEVHELETLPLILPGRPHSIRLLFDRMVADHRLQPRIELEVNGMKITKSLIARGLGSTIFSYAGASEEIEAGTLAAVPIREPAMRWEMAFVTRANQSSVALARLGAMVQSHVRRLIKGGVWRGELIEAPAGRKRR